MASPRKIAILTGRPDEAGQAEFIKGFEQKAFALGFDVYVFAMYRKYQNTAAREAGESSVFDLVRYEDYDGIVLMTEQIKTPGLIERIEEQCKRHAKGPVICVEKSGAGFPVVTCDHRKGISMITDYLTDDLGYKDIAFITEGRWDSLSPVKLGAFREALASKGISPDDRRIIQGRTGYEGGKNAVRILTEDPEGLPQAVLCTNDELAAGVTDALIEAGYKVPMDIAVAGYDSRPADPDDEIITSVSLSKQRMGSETAAALIRQMDGASEGSFSMKMELVYGSTTPFTEKARKAVSREYHPERKRYGVKKISDTVPDYLCEDMMNRQSIYDLLNILLTYAPSMDDSDGFMIYLNDSRPDAPKEAAEVIAREEGEPDPFRHYTPYMMKALTYNRGTPGSIGTDVFFDRRNIIFDQDKEGEAEGFIITPLFFEDKVFGYAVRSSYTPGTYSGLYRYRLRDVMLGLENLSRSEDIMRKTKALEDRMIRDPLTGLYNYRGFSRHADSILFRFRKLGAENIGVLAIDIKGMTEINNTRGREAGNEVLTYFAKMIRKIFPNSGVFRFGGDQFIVVNPLGTGGIREFDNGLIKMGVETDLFNREKKWEDPIEFHYGTAMGKPSGRKDLAKLITEATLVNKEKKNARLLALALRVDEDSENARKIDEIIEKNAFKYMFQPIIDSSTGEIFAYEALMRADLSPEVTPQAILEYAARTGRLYEIEKETIGNVLTFVSEHSDYFDPEARIFINSIPGSHLTGEDMNRFSQMASKTSNKIVIELTEHGQLTDDEIVKSKKLYEDLGMETAIDDYGTGYSNTGNLLRYMPDYVKIDRLLLTDIDKSPAKQRLVSDTISFCRENGIKSLAEGIETAEELRTVISLGADLLQGYYLARPSTVIPRALKGDIIEEILSDRAIEKASPEMRTYIAGFNPVIRLSDFEDTNVNSIRIPSANANCSDIVISGFVSSHKGNNEDKKEESLMTLHIEEGYRGTITLNNTRLSGTAAGIAVDIGEDSDVTLILKRNNELTGSIRVAETSTLHIEGDGNLEINVSGGDVFGIGNSSEKGNGRIIFEQDGLIKIKLDGASGVAIGSGTGGIIEIKKGRYDLSLTGAKGAAIGSIKGPADIRISDCVMDIENELQKGVSVGSVSGDCIARVEHIAFTNSADTSEGAGIGSVSGKADIYIVNGSFRFTAKATSYIAVGSCTNGNVNVITEYISFEGDVTGHDTGLFGSLAEGAHVSMSSSLVEGTLKNDSDMDINAADENIKVVGGRTRIIVNDRVLERGE